MTIPLPLPTDEQLINTFGAEDFFSLIHQLDDGATASLRTQCVDLHNSGKIDFLSLSQTKAFHALSSSEFFNIQDFIAGTIPQLNANEGPMLEFVAKLVEKAGNDYFAYAPNEALGNWLKARPERATRIIDMAKWGDGLAVEHLTFALQSLANLNVARAMTLEFNDRRRLGALTAVSRILHKPEELKETLEIADQLLRSELDDLTRAHTAQMIVQSHVQAKHRLNSAAIATLTNCFSISGSACRNVAAKCLTLAREILTADLIDVLLNMIARSGALDQNALRPVDIGLSSIAQAGFVDEATSFVEKLLLSEASDFDLDNFGSFTHVLLSSKAGAFHSVLVRWLLIGDRKLCDGLSGLVRQNQQDEKPLNIDFGAIDLSEEERIFICRKAIGYFFLQPVVAASIIVSVLRTSPARLHNALGEMLFDPLLRNLSGALRKYLEELEEEDATQSVVKKALSRAETYLAGLKLKKEIKELSPSVHQREIVRTRWNEQMQSAAKEAEKHSVLLNLVHRSILLYGRQSLTYIEEASGGNRRPVEVEMQRHEFGFELPKQSIFDNTGLEQLLLMCRAERIPR